MSNWYYGSTEKDNELMHYGILGMKWGHRKSRPSGGGNKANKKARRKKLAKRLAIGAGTAAAAGLAGAYAYKRYKSGKPLSLPGGGTRLGLPSPSGPSPKSGPSQVLLGLPSPQRTKVGGTAIPKVKPQYAKIPRAKSSGYENPQTNFADVSKALKRKQEETLRAARLADQANQAAFNALNRTKRGRRR